jgi:hypothetical protein
MRLLKAQNTNLRNIYGKGVKYDVDDQVIMDSTNSVLVPKGTTAERPLSPNDGHIRFNTSTDGDGAVIGFEAYYDNGWRRLRFKEPNQNPGIVWQNLGTGDATEVKFGILDSGDPDYPIPDSANNIIVLIENVVQIPTTNYVLTQNPSGNSPSTGNPYPAGWYIDFGATPVPLGKDVTVIHNLDK